MAITLSEKMAHVSYEIRDIVVRAKKVQASGKKVHWLNIGDPNQFGFSPPKHVTEGIIAALHDKKYSAYCPSEGDPELREAIGRLEGVPAENVTVHNGLSEGIDFLFQALLNPGENIMMPSPCYPLYITKLKASGGHENYYQCDENFIPQTDEIRRGINSKTQAIVLINPNNPTGATYPRKILEEIVNIAGEHNLPIIADEIYDRMTIDSERSINMRELSKDVPLVSGNGISKNFLYPGARVGYLALRGNGIEELRGALVKLCNQRLSVNWEMQRGALAAYTGPMDHIAKTREELRIRRDIVYNGFNSMPGISCVKPSAAFYAFPKVELDSFKTDKEFAYSLLDETGVLVVPGSAFAPSIRGKYFRLVFLAPPDELHEALSKIERFVEKRKSG